MSVELENLQQEALRQEAAAAAGSHRFALEQHGHFRLAEVAETRRHEVVAGQRVVCVGGGEARGVLNMREKTFKIV